MVVTEVEEVGKKAGKLMMRWFSGEFFSDTESIGDSFAIFLILGLIFNCSSGHWLISGHPGLFCWIIFLSWTSDAAELRLKCERCISLISGHQKTNSLKDITAPVMDLLLRRQRMHRRRQKTNFVKHFLWNPCLGWHLLSRMVCDNSNNSCWNSGHSWLTWAEDRKVF